MDSSLQGSHGWLKFAEMNRRDFHRIAGAGFASALLAQTSQKAYVEFNAATQTWTLGNAFFEREMAFDPTRGLVLKRFVHRATGQNWMADQPRHGPDIYLIIEDEIFFGAAPGSRFQYVDHERRPDSLQIRLKLSPQNLIVRLNYRLFDDSCILEQWCTLENASGKAIGPIERFDPFLLPLRRDDYILHWVQGIHDYGHQRGVGENLQPFPPYRVRREPLIETISLISVAPGERYGRKSMSTTENLNWFALEDPRRHCGLIGGLEWSGAWALHFAKLDDAVLVYGGVDKCSHMLQPGATLESPRVFYGPYQGELDDGLRDQHSYLKKHFIPAVDERFPWVTYNTWYAFSWRFTEDALKREADIARDLGIECFYVDAGWWESESDAGMESGLGAWIESRRKFPSGLKTFADYVRGKGMKFGIWVEPERANAQLVGKEISEKWLSKHDGLYVGLDESRVLCFGNPEVRDWVRRWLARMVRDYGVEWIRWDLNAYNICTRPDHGHQTGDGDYAHIRGLYEVWQWLNRNFPQVRLESCAGGGNRNDFGAMRYAHTTWISDASWPSYRVRYQVLGCSYPYPSRYQNSMYVYQGGLTGHSHSYGKQEIVDERSPDGWLDYLFRSRMMGAFGISDRMVNWPENVRAAARRAIHAMKRARPILQGDVYHLLPQPLMLTPPISPPAQWEAIEYHHPERDAAVVFCFRALAPETEMTLAIRGVRPGNSYKVTYENSGEGLRLSGADLLKRGIRVPLPERERSEIVWIERA